MKKLISGLVVLAALVTADTFTAPDARATGSWLPQGSDSMPKFTFLSRSFRWMWDPFRVEGADAYAVAYITNNHDYAVELKTYCKDGNRMLRSLFVVHSIAPGETFKWDTRRLVAAAKNDLKAVVTCQFWIDGKVDLRGQIVNRLPVRMGQEGTPHSLITFNYANFPPRKEG